MPRKVVNTRRKDTAVTKLTEISQRSDKSAAVAERDRHRKFAGMLKAFNAGMTYDEIADVTGLSKIRVSQILQEQRNGA